MPNFKSNKGYKTVSLTSLASRISDIKGYPLDDVKSILGCIVPEIHYELSQGNKFNLSGFATFIKEKSKREKHYDMRLKAVVKNRYIFKVKTRISASFIEQLNFLEKKNY